MPPMPTTGILTACAASYTMRTAIGLIAGPESPAVTFEIRGLRVSVSIAIAMKVLTRDTTLAPASCETLAICAMLVTLGESFTINGRWVARLAVLTTSSSSRGSLPNCIPPCAVLGHETFNS